MTRNEIWQLAAVAVDGTRHRVAWGLGDTADRTVGVPGPEGAVWRRTLRGWVEAVVGLSVIEVIEVERRDDSLRLVLRSAGPATPHSARLVGPRVTVPADRVTAEGDLIDVVFPLHVARWGRPARVLPSGLYGLEVETDDGVRRPWPSWPLLDRLPEEDGIPKPSCASPGRLPAARTVRVRAPLTDEEWGQHRAAPSAEGAPDSGSVARGRRAVPVLPRRGGHRQPAGPARGAAPARRAAGPLLGRRRLLGRPARGCPPGAHRVGALVRARRGVGT